MTPSSTCKPIVPASIMASPLISAVMASPTWRLDLHAVTPEQFSAWATATSASGPVLDEAAYRNLLTQSKNLKPYTYRAVQRNLYGDIVLQRLPPGEGRPWADQAFGISEAGELTCWAS